MKKTLLTTGLVLAMSLSTVSANAFCWRNLNPASWGTCPKCEKTASSKCNKQKCTPPCQKQESACPTEEKACTPEQPAPKCNSCTESSPCTKSSSCDACDKLQQKTEKD